MTRTRITRRAALRTAAAAAALPLVHVRTAGAAGKLKVAVTTNFTPGADAALQTAVGEWAAQTNTDVRIDILAQYGNQERLTIAAEAQARAGHDVVHLQFPDAANYAHLLEPVDDVVGRLEQKYGRVNETAEYVCKIDGHWAGVPTYLGSGVFPCVGRMDVFKQQLGMDLQARFPAKPAMGPDYDRWTWDAFLAAAATCAKAGMPFGLPVSTCDDASSWLGMLFRSYGAELMDAAGNVAVNSAATRSVLDYLARLAPHLPPDVYSWDNASNNKALVAGRSALILNPSSAWAQAVKDQSRVGSQCWHFPAPAGPNGRFLNQFSTALGVWSFSANKSAAKALIEWLGEREQAERLCTADHGFGTPPFISMSDFGIWEREGPPTGTLYNYPNRPAHRAAVTVPIYPAPMKTAPAIYNLWIIPNLAARVMHGGESIEQAIAWAERELDGLKR
jgi:ABC-type glycerol-3-phosphate transport system substrate-binding protein